MLKVKKPKRSLIKDVNNNPIKFKIKIEDIDIINTNKYQYFDSKGISKDSIYYLEREESIKGYFEYFINVTYNESYVDYIYLKDFNLKCKIKYFIDLDNDETKLSPADIDIFKSLGAKISKCKRFIDIFFNIEYNENKNIIDWDFDEDWDLTKSLEVIQFDFIKKRILLLDDDSKKSDFWQEN